MKRVMYFLIITIVSVITWGCPDDDGERLWVINKSEKDILYHISMTDGKHRNCSDTLLSKEKLGSILEKGEVTMRSFDSESSCDTIRVFLLDIDTINTYSWEKIRLDNNIIKRYDLSLEDLKKMDWRITYP